MSDEKLRRTGFAGDGEEVDAGADTEREPPAPPASASTPRRGAALSVLWWEADEPRAPTQSK